MIDLAAAPAPRLQLRDYQLEAVEAVEAGLHWGLTRLLIAIATGGGKTIIFS